MTIAPCRVLPRYLLFAAFAAFTVVCVANPRPRQAPGPELPPLDNAPTLAAGQASFEVSLSVASPELGLSLIITEGMKVVLSDHTATPPANWYVVAAKLQDLSQSLFVLTLQVVAPSRQVDALEADTNEFVDSGGLADAFNMLGIPSLQVNLASTIPGGVSEFPDHTAEPAEEIDEAQASVNPEEPFYDPAVDAALLADEYPIPEDGLALSRGLDLHIRSPMVFFPEDLKNAIKWFLAEDTESVQDYWYMEEPMILNLTAGQYITTFSYYGGLSEVDIVVERAERYVVAQGLTVALRQEGVKNANVTLVPTFPLPKVESVPSSTRRHPTIDILFRISAPLTGLSSRLLSTIKQGGAEASSTSASNWMLRKVEEEDRHGPYTADFAVPTTKGAEAATVRRVTALVRSRQLDYALWEAGSTDVRIRLRARMTALEENQAGGGAAITSTAGTVTASIAGVVGVLCIGAAILCLVPRGDNVLGPSRSQNGEAFESEDGVRRKWWSLWR